MLIPSELTELDSSKFNLPNFRKMLVTPSGFEPLASGLGIPRSIQLSYGAIDLAIKHNTL